MEHSSTITDTVPVANSFLTWPGEIHNQIYAELVPRDLMVCDNNWTADLMCPIHLNRRKPGCPQDWNKTWHNSAYRREFYRKYSLAMSGTCRQIRTEVLSVLPGSVCLTMCFWCRGIHLYQYGLQPYLPLVRKLVINGFNEESGTAWRELIGELPALEEFTFAIAALAHSKLVLKDTFGDARHLERFLHRRRVPVSAKVLNIKHHGAALGTGYLTHVNYDQSAEGRIALRTDVVDEADLIWLFDD